MINKQQQHNQTPKNTNHLLHTYSCHTQKKTNGKPPDLYSTIQAYTFESNSTLQKHTHPTPSPSPNRTTTAAETKQRIGRFAKRAMTESYAETKQRIGRVCKRAMTKS
jgi:hypothetical protein